MGKFDASGALTGAASGAAVGSAFGPIGTGLGALGGGLLGAFKKKKKSKKVSTLDANQQGLYNDTSAALRGEGPLKNLYNFDADAARNNFNSKYAQPAYQNFNENIVPKITGQFRGANLQNSSYAAGALSKAGTDVQKHLDTQLADMLYQGQNASVERRIQGLNNILGMQTFAHQQPQQSAGDQAFSALTEYGGKAAGKYLDNKFKTAPQTATSGTTPGTIPGLNPVYKSQPQLT